MRLSAYTNLLECPQILNRKNMEKPLLPANGHAEGLEHLLAQTLYWLKFNSSCVQVQVACHGVLLLLLRCNLHLREGVQRTISKTEPQEIQTPTQKPRKVFQSQSDSNRLLCISFYLYTLFVVWIFDAGRAAAPSTPFCFLKVCTSARWALSVLFAQKHTGSLLRRCYVILRINSTNVSLNELLILIPCNSFSAVPRIARKTQLLEKPPAQDP